MEYLPPTAITDFLRDLNDALEAVRYSTIQDVRQQRLYRQWSGFSATLSVNPTLQYPSIPRINLLRVYGHRVWHAKYSKHQTDRPRKELVSQAWGAIATFHILDGLSEPRKPANYQAETRLNKRLMRQLKTYGLKDPPFLQENATPLGIIYSIVNAVTTSSDPRVHHITDLVTIGFYFFISSCEYTKCTSHRRTVQFRPVVDFMFFVGDFLLPGDAPAEHFRQATQIVITLDNQKNAICAETVSQFHSESAAACLVKADIDIFLRLHNHTPISNFPHDHGLHSVRAYKTIAGIRAKCVQVGAARLGFASEDVGMHSLRSGGDMAMYLVDRPDQTLMGIGR